MVSARRGPFRSAMKPVLNTQTRIWVAVLLIGAVFILVALMGIVLAMGASTVIGGFVGNNIFMGLMDRTVDVSGLGEELR